MVALADLYMARLTGDPAGYTTRADALSDDRAILRAVELLLIKRDAMLARLEARRTRAAARELLSLSPAARGQRAELARLDPTGRGDP